MVVIPLFFEITKVSITNFILVIATTKSNFIAAIFLKCLFEGPLSLSGGLCDILTVVSKFSVHEVLLIWQLHFRYLEVCFILLSFTKKKKTEMTDFYFFLPYIPDIK